MPRTDPIVAKVLSLILPSDVGLTTVSSFGASIVAAVNAAAAKTLLALTKTDVGLANVDNTSDANKPVSTAQATADGLRVLKAGDTMTGSLAITGGSSRLGIGTASPAVPSDIRASVLYRDLGVAQLQVGGAPATVLENGSLGANDFTAISCYNGKFLIYKGNHSGNAVQADLKATIDSTGRLQLGGTAGLDWSVASSAFLQLPPGIAPAGCAPLKFTAGTNLSTPEAGAVEFDGAQLYLTIGSTRFTVPITKVYTPTLTPAVSVAGNDSTTETYTVSGLTTTDTVCVNGPAQPTQLVMCGVRVSAANTLEIGWHNAKGTAQTPATGTYRIVAIRS